jgi:hypothetical protein
VENKRAVAAKSAAATVENSRSMTKKKMSIQQQQ